MAPAVTSVATVKTNVVGEATCVMTQRPLMPVALELLMRIGVPGRRPCAVVVVSVMTLWAAPELEADVIGILEPS